MTIYCFVDEYKYLSNFAPVKFEWNGIKWPSCNHAYQAAKIKNKDAQILISQIPHHSKLSTVVDRYPAVFGWEESKIDIMTEIVRAKFEQNAELANKLLETGTDYIEYGNADDDTFWGISPIRSGCGLNNLGLILMEIREELIMKQEKLKS